MEVLKKKKEVRKRCKWNIKNVGCKLNGRVKLRVFILFFWKLFIFLVIKVKG